MTTVITTTLGPSVVGGRCIFSWFPVSVVSSTRNSDISAIVLRNPQEKTLPFSVLRVGKYLFFSKKIFYSIGIENNFDGYVHETGKIFTLKNVDRFFRLPRTIYYYLPECHTREFVFPLRKHKGYSRPDQYTDAFDSPRLHTREYTYGKSSLGNL